MTYFKSRLFLKYIWSYLFILLIPLVFLTVFIYHNAVTNLRTEIEQSRLAQLTQAKVIVDGRMKELGEIASRISYDKRLTPYRVHDPIYSGEAITALDQYKATSSIIGEIYLYFHQDGKIYSSKGLNDYDVFAENVRFRSWDKDALYRDLNTFRYPTMRASDSVSKPNGMQETMLAYLIPITPNNPNPHGTVMYLIKEPELTGLIDSILGNYQGLTYILDNQGRPLVDNRQGEALSAAEAKSLFDTLTPGIYDRTLNGKPHSIVSVKSESNGWTYVTIMPSAQFFSSVLHVRSFIIMLFIIVVIAGAGIALLLARAQYLPISTLVAFAASKSAAKRPGTADGASGNELDRIRSALQEYSSRIDLQEPFARNHFLSLLLKYGNAQSLTPELQDAFDLSFDRARHFVLVAGWEQDGELGRAERQEIAELLAQLEFPELAAQGYGVELSQPDQFGLMLSFDPGSGTEEFEQVRKIVEAVRSMMLEAFDFIPVIGVGTCYASPDQLNQSFIEACSAFELRMSSGSGTVTYFEKLSYTSDQAVWIPANTLMKLAQSLKQGNYDVSAQMIQDAVRGLQHSELSALLMRCVCFDLLNTILKTASELGHHRLLQEMAPNAAYGKSLDELERGLLNLAAQLCNQVEQTHRKEEQSVIDRIAAYIDVHYVDANLSLETVAFEFGISPSHLSRSFKEKLGLNFIQYIWKRRLEQVMHRLATTGEPLKDIILTVGYLDTPNFIRKFKKETGYTPGQYRKMFAAGNGLAESAADAEDL
ncbi:helix-turn-helix domain-containing protein [Paenibacillus glycinis]|uniref:Helix-turn-helix domain-containing protein n=1 Tax=Paenibacillus glycinis TaxID=2697035 RepID=A0ABW9XV23_9BACL|nr:helix-turn-helix domain-containing protein [Paenibacillus glycinis]NBD26535.1 helix-turn-helix domain-containing protein [Paenibacillus glycinis]